MDIPYWYPTDAMQDGFNTAQPMKSHNIQHIHQFYTKRNLYILSKWMDMCDRYPDKMIAGKLKMVFTGVAMGESKLNRYLFKDTSFPFYLLSGTLYVGGLRQENNPIKDLTNKALLRLSKIQHSNWNENICISTCSSEHIGAPNNSVDYIFVDPPFGGNLNYSELSCIWEAWLRVKTDCHEEAIMNSVQKKELSDYQRLMTLCFEEFYRILKPGRWMTVEFHNSKNSVWNSIQEALLRTGFIVADIRTLDKQQQSFKQVNFMSAVKQDLVISAYKPKESFVREFQSRAGDPDMAWEFVRQHLANVPVAPDGNHDGKIDLVAERCDYLLFDRMVAWHIMNGIPVPMDAHTFYEGLRTRFIERDGMFFLPDQVNEYDEKRLHMDLDVGQLAFTVTNEKTAIDWLRYILGEKAMTYQEIQPLYLQELHQVKSEKMPELLDMLKDNFVQDDKGAWYVPDLNNAADLAKLRTKKLVKEFYDSYATGKSKLKVFRLEAIRAGFDDCWANRDYKTIVSVGDRLPEDVLQEDPSLLMYYDNASNMI